MYTCTYNMYVRYENNNLACVSCAATCIVSSIAAASTILRGTFPWALQFRTWFPKLPTAGTGIEEHLSTGDKVGSDENRK